MSQENVAVVQRAFIAWNTGDFYALVADSASDVVWNLSRVEKGELATSFLPRGA